MLGNGRNATNKNREGTMKTRLFVLLAVLLTVSLAYAEDPIRPDPALTPGAVLTTDLKVLCVPNYTKEVRHVTEAEANAVYKEYNIKRVKGQYEVDHLISLELGGSNDIKNLWPQSYVTQPWNAHVKDRLEDYLHREVCKGHLEIKEVQKEISGDWIAAYKKYLGGKK
jgi:hypothetical protein